MARRRHHMNNEVEQATSTEETTPIPATEKMTKNVTEDAENGTGGTTTSTDALDNKAQMQPLMVEKAVEPASSKEVPMGTAAGGSAPDHSAFWKQAMQFAFCFCGLQASYLTWGYMQELIMTTTFNPTKHAPDGKFPSAAFCVFSNRFLAIIVAMIAVKLKHGAIVENNVAPLIAFTPCALSNTMSSWSQYASLRYVSFPVQTVFKSSKIIPVMIMGKFLKGTSYPTTQYVEAALITTGVAVFSVASKTSSTESSTEVIGLLFMCMYITFDCFTSQWQDKIYVKYGRPNVDPYQMMLGVNSSAIVITTTGLIVTGDFPKVYEFLLANPAVLQYNIVTAITSATGQLFIYHTIKEFGPIVFTIIMTTRQMISITISSIIFAHPISAKALVGAVIVFGVLFYQIRRKYLARKSKEQSSGGSDNAGSAEPKVQKSPPPIEKKNSDPALNTK